MFTEPAIKLFVGIGNIDSPAHLASIGWTANALVMGQYVAIQSRLSLAAFWAAIL